MAAPTQTSPLGVPYREIDGSPTVKFGRDGATATRAFLIEDWDQIYLFCRELIGSYITVGIVTTFTPPIAFPGFPGLLVNDLAVAPHMTDSPGGDGTADLANATNSYPKGAIITANYSARYDIQGGGDSPEIPEGTTILVSCDQGLETYATPGRVWRYTGTGALVDPDTHTGILIPTAEWNVTWSRVPLPPWDTIRAARGKLNDATFLRAPASTVMFSGFTARRMFQFVDAGDLWELTYRFREAVKTQNDGTEVGWNHFYKEQGFAGEHWLPVQNEDGDPIYEETDFSRLFEFAITTV